jgi:hypothetical protein
MLLGQSPRLGIVHAPATTARTSFCKISCAGAQHSWYTVIHVLASQLILQKLYDKKLVWHVPCCTAGHACRQERLLQQTRLFLFFSPCCSKRCFKKMKDCYAWEQPEWTEANVKCVDVDLAYYGPAKPSLHAHGREVFDLGKVENRCTAALRAAGRVLRKQHREKNQPSLTAMCFCYSGGVSLASDSSTSILASTEHQHPKEQQTGRLRQRKGHVASYLAWITASGSKCKLPIIGDFRQAVKPEHVFVQAQLRVFMCHTKVK